MAIVTTWDFTCWDVSVDVKDIRKSLRENCSKWAFQLEEVQRDVINVDDDDEDAPLQRPVMVRHWQGRLRLRKKERLAQVVPHCFFVDMRMMKMCIGCCIV